MNESEGKDYDDDDDDGCSLNESQSLTHTPLSL